MKFLKYVIWLLKGKPTISYTGFSCGMCGKWVDMNYKIAKYLSAGAWMDTTGFCNECLSVSTYRELKEYRRKED